MLIQKSLLILAAKYFGAFILLLLVNLVTFTVLIMRSTKVSLYRDIVLYFFSFFSKTSASEASVEREKEKSSIFSLPHPYPLALAINKSPAV